MRWRRSREICLLAAALLGTIRMGVPVRACAAAMPALPLATVPLTTVQDTIYTAAGMAASGTLSISWPAFTTAGGSSIPAGSTAVTLGADGLLSVALAPNAGADPMGSYYTVIYRLSDGSSTREYWVIPASVPGGQSSVRLNGIRSTVLPASVAMQTVSKNYVDQAIAAAVTGTPQESSPYAIKAGDTMTGPLALPGDPVSPLQAADKNYVDEQVAGVAGSATGPLPAARLPVFGGSGPSHAPGAVPDPGAVAGSTRFLREDGMFTVPPGTTSASVYAANGQVQADAVAGTTMFGGLCLGDSLMYGMGATVAANGMCQMIGSDLNMAMKDFGIPGDTAGDLAWQSFTYLNPSDSGNPAVVAMIGPNDTSNGPGGLLTFTKNEYAAYSWAALPARNKTPAAGTAVTGAGSWSAYTNFPNLPGLTAVSAGSTLTYTAQVGPGGVLYLWYGMTLGSSTLTVAIDGMLAVDTVTGEAQVGTALSYAPTTHSYSAGLARFATMPGSHTVTVTANAGVTVLGFGVPPTTRLRGSSAPRIVMGGTSQLPDFTVANTQIYNAASVAVSQQLVADGLNVPFADVQNGAIDWTADFSTSATPACPASTAVDHPNDCGHRHYAGVFEAQMNTAPTLFSGTGGLASPLTAAGPFNFNYGAVPTSAAQFTSFGPRSYANSLEAGVQLCPQDAQELCGIKPHNFGSNGYGMALYETTASSPLGFCWGLNGNPAADAQFNCPVYMTSDGTVHAASLSVASPVTVAGSAPECAPGPGAGANPQCSITGTPQQFVVSLTADAAATPGGKILTAYFNPGLQAAYRACMVSPQALTDTNPAISPAVAGVPTSSYVTLTAGANALTAGTTYHWAVSCF